MVTRCPEQWSEAAACLETRTRYLSSRFATTSIEMLRLNGDRHTVATGAGLSMQIAWAGMPKSSAEHHHDLTVFGCRLS